MMDIDRNYWEERYKSGETGWDIGHVSTPLKEYFDQLNDRDLRILIPGCGNAYEAAYLHDLGFSNVHVIDLTPLPFEELKERCPSFPPQHMKVGDFFEHKGEYDLVIEQTFFCALHPSFRQKYATKMKDLLAPEGKVVGLLFDDPLYTEHPPFGGNREEYMKCFEPLFVIKKLERAYNSIDPRKDRELFFIILPR